MTKIEILLARDKDSELSETPPVERTLAAVMGRLEASGIETDLVGRKNKGMCITVSVLPPRTFGLIPWTVA